MTTDQGGLPSILPFVRRYARALVGNQHSADALVVATVQDLALTKHTTGSEPSKVEVYQRFTRIWRGPVGRHIQSLTPISRPESAVERRLSEISTRPRQAFLLNAVEGFTPEHISEIMEIEQIEVDRLLAKAREQILGQVSTDILIIEDEMFIAADLEDIVVSLGHRVVGIERTHTDAIKLMKTVRPGLILADIQLADGSSGIDAVNQILLEFQVPVIFITAYPERLLTGLRPEPTFVLTKPYRDETVKAVVSEALFFESNAKPARRMLRKDRVMVANE